MLRAGFGIFYDRFKQQYLEQAQLLNGITQQSFVVTNPDFFPNLPTPGANLPRANFTDDLSSRSAI